VSVLKGEGKVPILFGGKSVASGAVTHETYLARPDLAGQWPTIVIVPSAWGVTSSVKDLARRLARQGFAAMAVDLFRGTPPDRDASFDQATVALDALAGDRVRRDLTDVIRYIENPAGFWSNAEAGYAIMGVGGGGFHAAAAAASTGEPLVLVASPLPDHLAMVTAPILGLFGKDDENVPVDEVMAARSAVPHAEWALYDGVGGDFLDDHRDGFDYEAYQDAVERIAAFCEKNLPSAR
jgi:carboxymethylenebutenolidase